MRYDAIVVGSGPNGLAAAITLRQEGLSVLMLEAKATVGGGMRSAALTLPGFVHDVCSAVHPMALESPFFHGLPLARHGLEFISPPVAAAHPLDDGSAGALRGSVDETAWSLGEDEEAYRRVFGPLARSWHAISANVLGPPRWPRHPIALARFARRALPSALHLARQFRGVRARALWSGIAAHSQLALSSPISSAPGVVLALAGHRGGWPIPKGGSQRIADALAAHFRHLGGAIETGVEVKSLDELPSSSAVLLDVTPRQALALAGRRFSPFYRWQLGGYRYGMGVFKIDWALDGPVPFTAAEAREAGTVHLGGALEEVALSEEQAANGTLSTRPFVLLAQPSLFDPTRAPAGRHTAWAYCHVPNGSTADRTKAIEAQVERFAPGFRERILGRHTMNTAAMTAYNANYVGGDINGGSMDLLQFVNRPALRLSPYRTSAKGIYLCSSSTPPGGGVHGLCGYHAARAALADVFGRLPRSG